jgi:hypothetical protein
VSDAQLSAFLAASLYRFERGACAAGGVRSRFYTIAGHELALHFAGPALEPVLAPALEHLESAPARGGALRRLAVHIFDAKTTGVWPPAPPWTWSDGAPDGRIPATLASRRFHIHFAQPLGALSLVDLASDRALFWVGAPTDIPSYVSGAPLLHLLHAWLAARGLAVVHAACVGTQEGGLLLAGPGGSGKSTTALRCLEAGLRYVSDDYCVVDPGPPAAAHSLYCSGKLVLDQLARMDGLQASVAIPAPDHQGKPLLILRAQHAERLAPRLPLRAVVAPRVGGCADTIWRRLVPAAALHALAPSTLAQLPGAGGAAFRAMAALVRSLPCFELVLGHDSEQVPSAVQRLLSQVNDAHPAVV